MVLRAVPLVSVMLAPRLAFAHTLDAEPHGWDAADAVLSPGASEAIVFCTKQCDTIPSHRRCS